MDPKTLPRQAKGGAFKGVFSAQELSVATFRGSTFLAKRVVISRVNAIDSIQNVRRVPYGPSKGADCILMLALWDNTKRKVNI
jgi:hypothetical protein